MNTGALRHLVTLDTTDGAGGITPLDPPTWYCASGGNTNGIAVLTGRYHPGITTATRVHLKNRLYHVTTVLNRADDDTELILTCTEVFD